MKKILAIFFVILLYNNLLAELGEVIFKKDPNSIISNNFTVIINTTEHCWSYNKNNHTIILGNNTEYPKTFSGQNIYKFDAPKSQDANIPVMPWGKMNISVIIGNTTINYTVDFRDEVVNKH